MLQATDVVIRSLHDLPELSRCVELQRQVWGFADIDIVPEAIFGVAGKTGGQVLGAFQHDKLIGFALSFSAQSKTRTYLHSHMVAVLPKYQNQGVGRLLKLAQRQEALERGLDLIEWTFDPFQIKNAYFNIARLGAIVRRYIPNCYGRSSSPLHGGLPTDRLVAEWWLQSTRVTNALSGKEQAGRSARECIPVPFDIQETCQTAPREAEQIQLLLRKRFELCFDRGQAAVGFQLDASGGKYQMELYED
jgi:predicted GNAT superfamily acetyltransferase